MLKIGEPWEKPALLEYKKSLKKLKQYLEDANVSFYPQTAFWQWINGY